MHLSRTTTNLGFFVSLLLGAPSLASAQSSPPSDDDKVLAAAGLKTDAASLLDFFRRRTLTPAELNRLSRTVHRLGDQSYRVRNQAFNDLRRAGRLAINPLKEALRAPDPEVARRAHLCLDQVQQNPDAELAMAAARLIKRHPPTGAAQVLVDYLPFASDEGVIEAVQAALNAVARADKQSAPILVRALTDGQAARRAAAGVALTRAGPKAVRQATTRLLEDRDPAVRLKVALAFVDAHDRRGVPVLIASLADLPHEGAWPAEEVLLRLAGEQAPQVALGGDTPAAKVRDAWKSWWASQSSRLELAHLDTAPRQLGYTLIVQMDNRLGRGGFNGRVFELGRDGKPRWQVENLRYPLDAQFIPGDRFLVAEYLDHRVTERNQKGEVLWQKQVNLPIACQRLPNGHTFIATRNQLLDVDAKGKTTVIYNQTDFSIAGAQRQRNGEVYLVTNQGRLAHLDARGKEVGSFQVGQVYFFGGVEGLPGGRVLVPEYRNHRVAEYDARGKLVWQAASQFPTSAIRLANGHTLVTNMINQQVVEVNREGKVVWQHKTDGRPFRARRR
jgi:hypothetical protein